MSWQQDSINCKTSITKTTTGSEEKLSSLWGGLIYVNMWSE